MPAECGGVASAPDRRGTGSLCAGEVGAVYGLTGTVSGDIIGDPSYVPPVAEIAAPVLRVKVTPAEPSQYPALVAALSELSAEDPLLDVIWEKSRANCLCASRDCCR